MSMKEVPNYQIPGLLVIHFCRVWSWRRGQIHLVASDESEGLYRLRINKDMGSKLGGAWLEQYLNPFLFEQVCVGS